MIYSHGNRWESRLINGKLPRLNGARRRFSLTISWLMTHRLSISASFSILIKCVSLSRRRSCLASPFSASPFLPFTSSPTRGLCTADRICLNDFTECRSLGGQKGDDKEDELEIPISWPRRVHLWFPVYFFPPDASLLSLIAFKNIKANSKDPKKMKRLPSTPLWDCKYLSWIIFRSLGSRCPFVWCWGEDDGRLACLLQPNPVFPPLARKTYPNTARREGILLGRHELS